MLTKESLGTKSYIEPYKIKDFLDNQKQSLDYFFEHVEIEQIRLCVERLAKVKGTLFLTGVGKSGFIAQKITASLVSIGIKAHFLSPVDALHGDMGILDATDEVLIFSKSGESEELLNLIPFLRNKNVSITAIVCKEKNRLVLASNFSIYLPLDKELCPYDMIPTTSTELQLLFGDLLVVLLMEYKKTSLQTFAKNHPAGKLGKQLSIRVDDLMLKKKQLPLCHPNNTLMEILKELSEKKCGCILGVDENQILQGIFTDGDLRRALEKHGPNVFDLKMEDLLLKNPRTIEASQLACEAMQLMEADQNRPIMVLPVVDEEGKIQGLIKMHDILQAGLH